MANELEQRALAFLPAHWNNGFAEWSDENRREYAEEYATAAVIAALQQVQQPGAQAVAWRWRLRDGDCWSYTETDPAKHPDYFGESWQVEAVYTDPPPLPEAVSEEDVEAEAISLWHRFAPDDRIEWDEEPHKAEYRDAARSILESYRARLAAKGGV